MFDSLRWLARPLASALLLSALACDDDASGGGAAQDGDPAGDGGDAGGPADGSDADGTQESDAGQVDPGNFVPPTAPWFTCADTDDDGAVVVPAHVGVKQFWSGWEEGQNARNVDAVAEFPAEGDWSSVWLKVEVACPEGGRCDPWDRGASFALVEKDGEVEQPIELARHMTPYAVGMCFMADVSEFAARLHGPKTIRSFIDTWVGGNQGWQITSTFLLRKGEPKNVTLIPLWNNQAEDRIVDLGDPMPTDETKTLAAQLPPKKVTIPADAKKVELRYIVTGHGQGNQNNCAEFCPLDYTTTVGTETVKLTPWRGDCEDNPLNMQFGTWKYPRAGWCPGAVVLPSFVDITSMVTPGAEQEFAFDVLDNGMSFVNSCRPMAGGETNTCTGCVFDPNPNNCDYNNNGHTPPQARLSVQLVVHH